MAVTGAGRTDSGVHAFGQVISFDVDWRHEEKALLRALNAVLPDDIALQALGPKPGFHPRFDATSRRYAYYVTGANQPLMRQRTWQVYRALDLEAMNAAAALLVGEHDFATFGTPPQGSSTVRRVMMSEWRQEAGLLIPQALVYRVEATAFLQHMVRRIVGLLVEIGLGVTNLEAFAARFRAADLGQAGRVAPPQGLYLEAVYYGEHTLFGPDVE